MSTGILTGSVFPDPAKQQPYRYGRREGGRYAVVPYESVSQSQIDALAAQADSAGLNYEVSLTHGKARIEIEYNWNNVAGSFAGQTTEAETTWEIVPGMAMKDLLDSNNPLALACTQGALTEMKKRQLNGNLQASTYYDPTTGLMTRQTWGTGAGITQFTNAEMTLYQLLLDGVEQVEVPTPVLSRTDIVTAEYIFPANFTNVGLIYSSATLISSYGVPSTVLFDFPNDVDPPAYEIGNTGIYLVLQYGWLKKSPSVRQVTKQKWSIAQSWDYGLWSMALYGGTRL